jgi:hypothetical protein
MPAGTADDAAEVHHAGEGVPAAENVHHPSCVRSGREKRASPAGIGALRHRL